MILNLSSRKKEMLLTVASNLLLQIVTAVCGFILPPLIIGTFGSSVNGMVSSISQFIAYLNIVEAGVGGAAIVALYKPLAFNSIEEQNAILSATSKFYNRSGLLFTLLVVVLSILYPLIVDGEVDSIQSSLMVLVLGITGAAEFFLIGKYRVLLIADKKNYVISLIQMCGIIISTIFVVVFIKLGFGILFVKFVSALLYLGRYLFFAFYIYRKYEGLDFHTIPNTKAISQSKNVLIHQLGGLVVFNSPLIIITIFCSLKDVSVYAVYAMIFNAVNQLLGSFYSGIQSFFGESFVKDSIEKTQNVFGKYESFFYVIAGWFYSCAYILTLPFMYIYSANMTDALYIQPVLVVLFCFVGFANNMRRPCDITIMAAGHYRQTQWHSLAESVINVVASVLFTLRYGFIGVLLGSVVSYGYRTFDIIIYANKYILKRNPLFSILKVLFTFTLCYCFVFIISRNIHIRVESFLSWFLYALLVGGILGVPLLCSLIITAMLKRKIK